MKNLNEEEALPKAKEEVKAKVKKKIKLIIAGSTHIHDRRELEKALKKHKLKNRIEEVVVGQEPGMAQCGRIWAIENNIPVKRFVRFDAAKRVPNLRTAILKRGQMLAYADALLFITDGIRGRIDEIRHMAEGMKDFESYLYVIEKEEKDG